MRFPVSENADSRAGRTFSVQNSLIQPNVQAFNEGPDAMTPSIYEDALARPDLFHWFGITETEFDRWLTTLPLRIHPGLVAFWRRTGGGDLFESETILGPLVADDSDNVLVVNEVHWNKGLPRDMLISILA
jgi:hypothetical protein